MTEQLLSLTHKPDVNTSFSVSMEVMRAELVGRYEGGPGALVQNNGSREIINYYIYRYPLPLSVSVLKLFRYIYHE